MPDRRTFLRLLAGAALSQTFDLERALWVPGKAFFLPSRRLQEFVISAEHLSVNSLSIRWSEAEQGWTPPPPWRMKVGDIFTIEGVYVRN